MKKWLVLLSLCAIVFMPTYSEATEAESEIEIGAIGSVVPFYFPSTDTYEASVTGSAIHKVDSLELKTLFVFKRTYDPKDLKNSGLSLEVRTFGENYPTASAIRVEYLIAPGRTANATLYPTNIYGVDQTTYKQAFITYPITENHKVADAMKAQKVVALHVSYPLPENKKFQESFYLSDQLKVELQKLGDLDPVNRKEEFKPPM